jgi:FtsH-binding integral membrane protein
MVVTMNVRRINFLNPQKMDTCVRNTYLYLIAGIIILALGVALFQHLHINITNIWAYLGIFIAIFVLLFLLFLQSPGPLKTILAILLLLGLSLILTPLVNSLPPGDLWRYVVVAGLFFVLLSGVALAFPTRALSWGRILMILLIVLIIVGIIGLFLFRGRTGTLIYFLAVLAIFGAFVLYDTSVLVQVCRVNSGRVDYINQAISLLLDALNVFVGVSGVGSA